MAEPASAIAQGAKSIPPMVWVIAIGGGLGLSYIMSRRKTAASTADTGPPTALIYTGTGGGGSTADTPSSTTTGGPTTNEEWANRAKNFLIGRGNDGGLVNTAVDKFISAQALTPQEQALISQAITGVGPPPLPMPPVTGTTPPTQTGGGFSPANPILGRTGIITSSHIPGKTMQGTQYTVKSGDTITDIAARAYDISKTVDPGAIVYAADQIYNANWFAIKDGKNLDTGTVLYIPVIDPNDIPHLGRISLGGGSGSNPSVIENQWLVASGQLPETSVFYGSFRDYETGKTDIKGRHA